MSGDVKEAIIKCEICAEFQARNARMPMQSHPIPGRPWSRVAADQFQVNDKQHIALSRLKARLQDAYAQLVFVELPKRNHGEIAFCENFISGNTFKASFSGLA
eukprot:gene4277-4844_t